ncbi:MAG TPA: diguanylate cyclase [Thermoanaerobaculia bacterium]
MNAPIDRRKPRPDDDPQPLRLLVVDDDASSRACIAAVTRRIGFAVDAVAGGGAALEALASGAYDAVLIDHEMPYMTGIEVVARLRAADATKGIYAVMLTAHEDVGTKVAALDAGFDDFVSKSCPDVEMVAKLSAARRVAARQRTMNATIRELYGLATRDELTGLFNRRFFTAEVERLLAQDTPVGVILFDVDDFKVVNDTHGHLAGDQVLRDIGALFHRSTRPEDIVARLGGDELVMAIPMADLRLIAGIARRVARDVRGLQWIAGQAAFSIGISTGVASSALLTRPTLSGLLDAADRDLFKSKWLRKHPEARRRAARDDEQRPRL